MFRCNLDFSECAAITQKKTRSIHETREMSSDEFSDLTTFLCDLFMISSALSLLLYLVLPLHFSCMLLFFFVYFTYLRLRFVTLTANDPSFVSHSNVYFVYGIY